MFSFFNIPAHFLATLIKKTHDLAQERKLVTGVKQIPELLPFCGELLDADLKRPQLLNKYSDYDDLIQVVCFRCISYGMVLADTWHNDFNNLNKKAKELASLGPDPSSMTMISNNLKLELSDFDEFLEKVYYLCTDEYESKKNSDKDKRFYLKLPFAFYQLGISMMLTSYGL